MCCGASGSEEVWDMSKRTRVRLVKVRLLPQGKVDNDDLVLLVLERRNTTKNWVRVRERWVREYWYRRLVRLMTPVPDVWVAGEEQDEGEGEAVTVVTLLRELLHEVRALREGGEPRTGTTTRIVLGTTGIDHEMLKREMGWRL